MGYRLKPENLRSWTIPIRHLSDVPVSRNQHKTTSKLYQNVYMQNIRPYHVTRSPSNESAVYWSRDTDGGTWQ